MQISKFALTLIAVGMVCLTATAQVQDAPKDTTTLGDDEKDLIDYIFWLIKGRAVIHRDSIDEKTPGVYHFSMAPGVGYTLSSGFAAILSTNTAFYTSRVPDARLSNVIAEMIYTQKNQLVLHLQGNVWTSDNRHNIFNDWRYMKYPQLTFGLGGHTDLDKSYGQQYQYLRVYQTLLRRVGKNLYAGGGYSLDYHWDIKTPGDSTLIKEPNTYGTSGKTISSGLTLNTLYDGRDNPIAPERGGLAAIAYRTNLTALGSNTNWQSLRVEFRKYLRWPASTNNVIALWNFNWFTIAGNPPYLDLPATGWDPYNNTGRGYLQGRFRGRNMVYLETEYRFKITRNGLFGGVVFANAQSFSEPTTQRFEVLWPAAGLGARIKVNKHSRTNIAIDYGVGRGGSHGFFVNLGEVF
jgi:hypothetical protein